MDDRVKELLTSKIEERIGENIKESIQQRLLLQDVAKVEKGRLSLNGKTYLLIDKISQGAFGEVHLAGERLTGKVYAIKIIDKSILKNPQDASREIQNLRSMNHPNIIKLYGAVEMWGDGIGDTVYLIMEYAFDGNLHDYIKKNNIPEEKAKKIFCEIVTGVEYLHSKGIAHQGLKPQNILFDFLEHIKIGDFGLSKKFEQNLTSKYVAPEIVMGRADCNGCKADMYSLGIILHDLATKYGTQQMSPDCKALFEKLTSNDPTSRPSAAEVLKDKWLAKDVNGCAVQ